jgi:hypothetical protein
MQSFIGNNPFIFTLMMAIYIFNIPIISIIAFIEGIIYLTKSDESFDKTYVQNEKKWF